MLCIVLLLVSAGMFVISFFSYQEKGYLLNNAYLFASKEERLTMNKKPHYRQTAIVFCLLGIIFLLNAINAVLKQSWLFTIMIFLVVVTAIYAIVSSVKIESKKHRR